MTIDITPEAVERLAGPRTHICWTPDSTPEHLRELVVLVRASDLNALSAALTASQAETAIAALAMRERAAEICFVPEQAHIAWDMKNGNFPKRSARHEYIAAEIRALPTTFTDAELLAAAMQLPEVR